MKVKRRPPRQNKFFSTDTHVSFSEDARNNRTMMRLTASDRPGLLAEIGSVFEQCDIRLLSAKIATIGAEVDDVFFISKAEGTPVTCANALNCLRRMRHNKLGPTPADP